MKLSLRGQLKSNSYMVNTLLTFTSLKAINIYIYNNNNKIFIKYSHAYNINNHN